MSEVIQFNKTKATAEQRRFIEILAGDLKFDRHQRNAHVNAIINRGIDKRIMYLDELTLAEASLVIERFKDWKDDNS